jgi:alanyl-tRNA synthetase/misacylated tRNA(Ala) deacylase
VGFIHVLPPPTPFAAAAPSSSAPTRLYFYAGPRAAAHLATASRTLSRAAQVLSVPRAQLPERVGRLENNRFDTADANKALRLELARVLSDAPECVGHVAWVLRTSGATHDFEFMNAVASGFFARLGEDEVAEGRDEDKAAAMVIVSAPTNVSPALVLVQGRDAAKAKALYEEIKVALGDRVKGGGAKGRFMAKVEKWGGRDTLAVKKILASD